MHKFLRLASGVCIAVLTLAACDRNAEQRQIVSSELSEVDSKRNMLSQTIAGRRSSVAHLEQQLAQQQTELSQFRGRVEAFIMDHKMATAALAIGAGGAGAALNVGNAFTPSQQELGAWAVAGAALYALANSEEVMFVADQLIQADAYFKTLQGHVESTSQQLRTEFAQLQSEEQQLAGINQQAADLRSKLASLR